MINKEKIKTLAQETLGCGCPEEVFQHIDCRTKISLNDILLHSRINIGNRLLVYVVEMSDAERIHHDLPILIETGRKDRDDSGFNRFRLVLASERPEELRTSAENLFRRINHDEKVHLHIINRNSLPVNE
jgi:hypothetical protein